MSNQTFVRQNQPAQPVAVKEAAEAFIEAIEDEDLRDDAEARNLGIAYHVSEQHWSFSDASAFVRATWTVEEADSKTDAVLDTYAASLTATIDADQERLSFAVLGQEPFLVVAYR